VATSEFKSHPYYDASDAREWMSLRRDDWDELEPGPEKTLQDLLRADKSELCELALDRIRSAAGESYLAENPYPELGDFLFFPIGDQGYRVYIEWYFRKRPDDNSTSDFWWAIINRPYAIAPFPTGLREDYFTGIGWVVP
jgi:hypothetical protein